MKKTKMYLLFAALMGMAISCQKNPDVVPGDPGNPDAISSEPNQTLKDENRCIDPKEFVSGVNNPFFPLTPGTTYHYMTTIIDGVDTVFETNDFMVTNQTKVIQGVTCMVVHDVSKIGNFLLEDTYDWYAQDDDGNVWYFGEDTKKYDSNGNVSTAGSWEAGVNGAKAGYQMWAHPRAHVGQTYKQEYYAGIAEDKAKVINGSVNVSVPYGSYQNCIKTKEFTPLEPGINGFKIYKAGIGLLSSAVPIEGESSVLISITY